MNEIEQTVEAADGEGNLVTVPVSRLQFSQGNSHTRREAREFLQRNGLVETPEQTEIRRRLQSIHCAIRDYEFTSALTEDELEKCKLARYGKAPRKNVYPSFGRYMRVAIYLGGDQRTVALFPAHNIPAAMRMADFAIAFFWNYRFTAKTPAPTDEDLNLSNRRLEVDQQVEQPLWGLFQRLKDHWIAYYALPPQPAEFKKVRQPRNERRPRVSTLEKRMDGLETAMNEIEKRIDEFEITMKEIYAKLASTTPAVS